MTDEEKKAIEIVKGITEDDLLNYWEGPEEPYNAIQIVLKLIEKQSQEIEELKEENEKYKNPPFFDEDKYTENDKIKAKIEEVDYKMIAHQDVREAVKQVLESLLEKE